MQCIGCCYHAAGFLSHLLKYGVVAIRIHVQPRRQVCASHIEYQYQCEDYQCEGLSIPIAFGELYPAQYRQARLSAMSVQSSVSCAQESSPLLIMTRDNSRQSHLLADLNQPMYVGPELFHYTVEALPCMQGDLFDMLRYFRRPGETISSQEIATSIVQQQRPQLGWIHVAEIAKRVASTVLLHAQQSGWAHLDIKLENVLMPPLPNVEPDVRDCRGRMAHYSDGHAITGIRSQNRRSCSAVSNWCRRAMVADWDRRVDATSCTRKVTVGTKAYMAPEQLAMMSIDHSAVFTRCSHTQRAGMCRYMAYQKFYYDSMCSANDWGFDPMCAAVWQIGALMWTMSCTCAFDTQDICSRHVVVSLRKMGMPADLAKIVSSCLQLRPYNRITIWKLVEELNAIVCNNRLSCACALPITTCVSATHTQCI